MTEQTTAVETSEQRYARQFLERKEALKRSITINRRIICAALRAASYETVTVAFDGEGDDGAISYVEIKHINDDIGVDIDGEGDDSIRAKNFMDTCSILYLQSADSETPEKEIPLTLEMACRELTYDILELEARGWENGDGGYGDVTIMAEPEQAVFDMNRRFVEIENETATF